MWTTTELEQEGRRRFEKALADEGLSRRLDTGPLPEDGAPRRCAGPTRTLSRGWVLRLGLQRVRAQLARGARVIRGGRGVPAG